MRIDSFQAFSRPCFASCVEHRRSLRKATSARLYLLWYVCFVLQLLSLDPEYELPRDHHNWQDNDGQGNESEEMRTISSESTADIRGILRGATAVEVAILVDLLLEPGRMRGTFMTSRLRDIHKMPAGVAGAVHCVSNVGRSREIDARLTALLQDCRDAIAALSDLAAAPNPASEGACSVLPALVTTMLARGLDPALQANLSALRGLVTMSHLPGVPLLQIVTCFLSPVPIHSSWIDCWRVLANSIQ